MVISTCNEGRCIFCVRGSLDTDTNFYSNCSNKHFTVSFDATCTTCCCIYLITCKCCGLKYVGKTKNSVKTRFNGHRGNLCNGTEAFVMFDHFLGKTGHGISNMKVKPIELVDNVKLLKRREDHWIGELNTVYPYGLNMDASYGGVKNAYTHVMNNKVGKAIYSLFNVVKLSRRKRGSRRNTSTTSVNSTTTFDVDTWLPNILDGTLNDDHMLHTLRSEVFKLRKEDLKVLFLNNAQRIMSGNFYIHPQHPYFHYVIRDFCVFKLQKSYVKPSRTFIVLDHVNKLMDNVKLSRILSNKDVQTLFPTNNEYYGKPGVSFTYSKSIRSEIVNYKQVIEDPSYEQFQCNCHNYPEEFHNTHHGHIFTGNINIVKNQKLRNVMRKGFGYHDQQPPNKTAAYNAYVSGLDRYINNISVKLTLPSSTFQGWKSEILKKVRYALDKSQFYKFNNVLRNLTVKKELAKLKEDFVLIPVDKAAKNISIICKKYYIEVMSNEIQNSTTFQCVSDNKDRFVAKIHSKFPSKPYKLCNDKLPYLYATSKMHKDPINFRFITAGRDTAFSDISIVVSKCLKLLMNTARTSLLYRIKEIDNCIFVIDSRNKVINFLNKCNQEKGSKQISTWDFSTLYTKIPHIKLKEKLSVFVTKVFDCVKNSSKAANFISCSDKSRTAYYSKSKSKSNISLSCEELIKLINIVIDNSYVYYHNVVYRQVIGIPMGTNCAPFLANIFLHVYEYEYLRNLVNNGNIITAKNLSKTFRYQDDCVSINDDGVFKSHYEKMYPPEMVLKCTNISKATCTFLDTRISIFRGKFRYKSYDKRNDFNFDIANYPHLDGNVPISTSYGVYLSQLVRFCDINLEICSFLSDVKGMTVKFLKQGFNSEMLKNTYLKFRDKYLCKWSMYGVDVANYCDSIFTS